MDCDINCYSAELNYDFGVNYHYRSLLSACTDHVFSHIIFIVNTWRAWHLCCTAGHSDILGGENCQIFPSIIASELHDAV